MAVLILNHYHNVKARRATGLVSYEQLYTYIQTYLRGVSRWFTSLACGTFTLCIGPGCPELSKSYLDMASELFTCTILHVFWTVE